MKVLLFFLFLMAGGSIGMILMTLFAVISGERVTMSCKEKRVR